MANLKIKMLLKGEKPRLIDEWQIIPQIWDAIRFEVDHQGEEGLFILTGSAIYSTLLAFCSAVVVFPHHFGPSINTAPTSSSLYSNSLSAILFLYSFMLNLLCFGCKYTIKSWNYQIWRHIFTQFSCDSLPNLAVIRYLIWP